MQQPEAPTSGRLLFSGISLEIAVNPILHITVFVAEGGENVLKRHIGERASILDVFHVLVPCLVIGMEQGIGLTIEIQRLEAKLVTE